MSQQPEASDSLLLQFLGLSALRGGRPDLAAQVLSRAVTEAENHDDHGERCSAFLLYSQQLRATGGFDLSESYARQAAEEAEHLKNSALRFDVFLHYQDALRLRGRFSLAQHYCLKAVEEAESLADSARRSLANMSYGRLLWESGEPELAEPYLRTAAEEAERLGDPAVRCPTFMLYGYLLRELDRLVEAEPYSRRAVADANHRPGDYSTRLHTVFLYGRLLFKMRKYDEAVACFRNSQLVLAEWFIHLYHLPSIRNLLRTIAVVYEAGILACRNRALSNFSTDSGSEGFEAVEFIDGNKAIWVREPLHRLSYQDLQTRTDESLWESQADGWVSLVSRPPESAPAGHRGVQTAHSSIPTVCVHDLPVIPSPVDRPAAGPLLRDELIEWLSTSISHGDRNTVYALFDFVGHDLYVVPVRRGPDGRLSELLTRAGYFVIENAWMAVSELARQWRAALDELLDSQAQGRSSSTDRQPLVNLPADSLRQQLQSLATHHPKLGLLGSAWPTAVGYNEDNKQPPGRLIAELGRILQLDRLLDLIEPDSTKWSDLHLVLLPDSQLYQVPLHAAWVRWSEKSLLDTVGSVRYALSLRTLHTLEQIEKFQTALWPTGVPLRGAVFANPTGISGEDRFAGDLPGVADEVENLVATAPGEWQIYGDLTPNPDDTTWYASRDNLQTVSRAGTVLWTACHGGTFPDHLEDVGEVVSPGLLLCDAPLTSARIVAERYDFRQWWLVHASCCLLTQLRSEDADRQAEGFIAALVLRGCRRVSGAMWELSDAAAAEFAKHYVTALKRNVFDQSNRDPNGFAISLKEAVTALRGAENGRFDHEFFWAPFVLFGLG